MQIRPAARDDLDEMVAADGAASGNPGRRELLRGAIADGNALVAVASGAIAGYAVLEHSFYGNAFLALLVVRTDARRRGYGSALLRAAEARARTPKLFTSTNASNRAMQALLDAAGYERSGVIENLDPGDPEFVYVRFLGGDAA
ncbi:MAG: GNAT family N-acetyltransferase [Myxococcota bacterium]